LWGWGPSLRWATPQVPCGFGGWEPSLLHVTLSLYSSTVVYCTEDGSWAFQMRPTNHCKETVVRRPSISAAD
jgi:hypothetical protein